MHESITTASFRAVVSAVNRHRLDDHTVERTNRSDRTS